jgi:hypothetical protein
MTMANRSGLRFLAALAMAMVAEVAIAVEDQPEIATSSDLAAAFLVAYNDYAEATAKDTVPLTITEFPKRFDRVTVRKDGETAVVRFWPPRCQGTAPAEACSMLSISRLSPSQIGSLASDDQPITSSLTMRIWTPRHNGRIGTDGT